MYNVAHYKQEGTVVINSFNLFPVMAGYGMENNSQDNITVI